jgi:hypothetical protein
MLAKSRLVSARRLTVLTLPFSKVSLVYERYKKHCVEKLMRPKVAAVAESIEHSNSKLKDEKDKCESAPPLRWLSK